MRAATCQAETRSVLRGGFGPQAVGELRRALQDRREAHDRHELVELHLAAVDLLEEVHGLVDAAELGVVVLDVARGKVRDALHVDRVDHGVEDLLPRRVLEADRDHHHVALLVLGALVAEPDRGGLAAALELVDEDRRVEVEDVHRRRGAYPSGAKRESAAAAISFSPLYSSSRGASSSGTHSAEST